MPVGLGASHRFSLPADGASRLASGGVSAPASSFTNVRVNNPAEDTNQVDQTTQSETTIAVTGSNAAVGFNDSQHTALVLDAASGLTGGRATRSVLSSSPPGRFRRRRVARSGRVQQCRCTRQAPEM